MAYAWSWIPKGDPNPRRAHAHRTTAGAPLGMDRSLGAVTPGVFADIVAIEGDPLAGTEKTN